MKHTSLCVCKDISTVIYLSNHYREIKSNTLSIALSSFSLPRILVRGYHLAQWYPHFPSCVCTGLWAPRPVEAACISALGKPCQAHTLLLGTSAASLPRSRCSWYTLWDPNVLSSDHQRESSRVLRKPWSLERWLSSEECLLLFHRTSGPSNHRDSS